MPELIPAEPGTPAWLAARRQGVTATDIVSILGIGWKSAYWLYWNKLGQVPDEPDSDRFRLGRELESYIVQRWQDIHTERAALNGLFRSTMRPWQLATPDLLVYGCHYDDDSEAEPIGVLEVKSWADADRHSWADGPPATVRAQVLWQMDVMGVGAGHVGVVFLPSGEFRSHVIEHNGNCADTDALELDDHKPLCPACDDIELMRMRGAEFYARLQGELPPPDIDASAASLAAVKARFGDARKGKAVSVDGTLYAAYSDAKDVEAHWHAKARGYENELREQVGEAEAIEVDGQLVARRLVYDAQVKVHTRHVDSIRRVKQQGDDNE